MFQRFTVFKLRRQFAERTRYVRFIKIVDNRVCRGNRIKYGLVETQRIAVFFEYKKIGMEAFMNIDRCAGNMHLVHANIQQRFYKGRKIENGIQALGDFKQLIGVGKLPFEGGNKCIYGSVMRFLFFEF